MLAHKRVFPLIIVRASDSMLKASEAQFGRIDHQISGCRSRQAGGGQKGEPGLGQQGQDTKNADNYPAPSMTVSCWNSRFGHCQRTPSHDITIADIAGSGQIAYVP